MSNPNKNPKKVPKILVRVSKDSRSKNNVLASSNKNVSILKSPKAHVNKEFNGRFSNKSKPTRLISKLKTVVNKQQFRYKRDKASNVNLGQIVTNTIVLELVLNNVLNTVHKQELLANFNIRKSIDEVIKFHNDLILYLGIEFGTKKYKQVQNYCIQLMEGNLKPEEVDRLSVGIKDRWPNALGSIRPLWHQIRDKGPYRYVGDQIIRTLFSIQRTVEDFTNMDLSMIEYKGEVDRGLLKEFSEFSENKLKEFGYKINDGELIDDFIIKPPLSIEASGPNKVPKSQSAAYESFLLVNDEELFPPFKNMCKLTKSQEFLGFVEHVADKYRTNKSKKPFIGPETKESIIRDVFKSENVESSNIKGCLRKITAVPDVGNKSRIVAIPDYFTQCLLTPFENKILKVIKTLYPESSNIFDHSGGFDKLKLAIKPGTACLDASSWTDTFSVKFQRPLVKTIFGSEFADNWVSLVVRCKWSVKGGETRLMYRTGQGMGTKGSFAIASLAYLMLMEFLTRKHYPSLIDNIKDKGKRFEGIFNQIGDDSWNQDPKGLIFEDLTKLCGIPINKSKSKFATDDNLVGEFVSRNLNYGHDVSRISSSLCRNVGENIFYLTNLHIHINERFQGFPWNDFIRDLSQYRNSDTGKLLFPYHIWSGYYKSLIIDRIIRKDDAFSTLIIAIEHHLDVSKDLPEILYLREKLKSPRKDIVFRIVLLLLESEYTFSRIVEITDGGKEFFRRYPFGTFTKLYNNSFFNIDYTKSMSSFEDLTLLYIYSRIKDNTDSKMFKLSLGSSMPSLKLNEVLDASVVLRNELVDIYEHCFYTKKDRKSDFTIKARIDRSFRIQKLLTSRSSMPVETISLLADCLPNLSLLNEFDDEDFSSFIANIDNMDYSL